MMQLQDYTVAGNTQHRFLFSGCPHTTLPKKEAMNLNQTLHSKSAPGEKLWGRNFIAISLSSFFIFITFYILAVTLPGFVLEELQGNKDGIGLVTTVFVIAAVIFRPLAGKWLDEVDRKPLVLGSLLLFVLCTAGYLLIPSYAVLLILRFVHGIAFGVAATATSTLVLDVIPAARKGEGIGYFSLFMSLAMVIGPFVGLTIAADAGYTALFFTVAGFAFLALLCGAATHYPPRPKTQLSGSEDNGWSLRRLIEPKAMPIALSAFFLAFSYGGISTFISVYAGSLGLERVAGYFFIVFAAMVLLSRPFTGRLFDRKGAHVLVYPGIFCFVAGMIWLSQAYGAAAFLLAAGVIGLGYGAVIPSFQTLAVKSAPSHRSGMATATYFVFFDLGYGLGSYLLGLIAGWTDYHVMYFTGGLIVACSLLVYYLLHHRPQRSATASVLPDAGR